MTMARRYLNERLARMVLLKSSPSLMKRAHISVLHLAGRLNPGGIETWLLQVLQAAIETHFHMDVLVVTDQPGELDDAIRQAGARLFVTNRPLNPLGQLHDLRAIHRQWGPYDIIHSHVQPGGIQLRLAQHCGISIRIAHSHTTELLAPGLRFHQKIVARLTKSWVRRYATHGLACSERAAETLFGKNWRDDPRWQVLHYGIDLTPFRERGERPGELRHSLGLPEDAFVIGHVGRMSPEKNHKFLLTLAQALVTRMPETYLVLVGDGPVRRQVEKWIEQKGLTERVRLLGSRRDVPALMMNLFDLFLFPSIYEGLPLVVIEAQAAGLPIVASSAVPEEAIVIPQLIRRLSLGEPLTAWVEAVTAARQSAHAISRDHCLSLMERSDFNIETCTRKLLQIYQEAVSSTRPLD